MISLLNCDRATMWVLTSDKSKLWSMVQPANARRGAALMRLEVPISPSTPHYIMLADVGTTTE